MKKSLFEAAAQQQPAPEAAGDTLTGRWKRRAQATEQLYDRVKQQRDALLAACKAMLEFSSSPMGQPRRHLYYAAQDASRAAIAAAEKEEQP